jgi:hypothetical protein
MKMTETLRIALLDIAKQTAISGGYPHNWKVASRKKLVEMGLVEEIVRVQGVWTPANSRAYRPTAAGQYVVDRNKNYPFGEGHYFLTREDKTVFEFRINTIKRASHVVELQSVDGEIADNYSDPYYTIKEAEEAMTRAVPRYAFCRNLGWCVG